MAALAAADVLADLANVPGYGSLQWIGTQRFAVRLWPGHRLVVDIANDPLPRTLQGDLDVRSITRLSIVLIEVEDESKD